MLLNTICSKFIRKTDFFTAFKMLNFVGLITKYLETIFIN